MSWRFGNRAWLILTLLSILAVACFGRGNGRPLDETLLQETEARLTTMIELARAGDIDDAEETFVQIEPVLREASRLLADLPDEVILRAELSDAITRIEQELAGTRRADVLADLAADAQDTLTDLAEVLDLAPPD